MSVIYYSKFEIYNCKFNEIRDNKRMNVSMLLRVPHKYT